MRPAHTLVTWQGDFVPEGLPVEQWSFSLRLEPDISGADNTVYTTGAATMRTAWTTHLAPRQGSIIVLKKVTVAAVTALGPWATGADGGYIKGEYNGNDVGAVSNGNFLPLQNALAVSLVTARAGATGKGRFFLPVNQQALGSDGRLLAAARDQYLTSCQSFLNAVNAASGWGRVVVSSSKGYESLVTGVRIGRVVDTMRSRRRSLAEEYAALPVS